MLNSNKLSPRKFGYFRDNKIYEAIKQHRCLSQEQIQLMLFQEGMEGEIKKESALRQTQNRLRILKNKGLIKRWRCEIDESYNYYTEEIAQKEHMVMINWMFMWYMMKYRYEYLFWYDYQIDLGIAKPDLFIITYNPHDNEQPYKGRFFEMDKTVTNEMNVIKKYNKLLEEGSFNYHWWSKLLIKFPKIYIATTSNNRLKEINRRIEVENINSFNKPLKFKSFLVNDLKEECLNVQKGNLANRFNIVQLVDSSIRSNS